MHRDNGRKSFHPRTPLSHRNEDNLSRLASGYHQRMAEPRNSIAYGRTSLAPRSSLAVGSLSGRHSTLIVAGSKKVFAIPRQSNFKDSRQTSDRSRLAEMVNRMMNFFSSKDAPFQFSEKMFRSPSKNDFQLMFEFMFRQLDDSYSVQKIEDEVPRIFAALGYPVPIKQSTMVPIGAQHSWPSLLAALDWLIDIIEMEDLFDLESLGANQLAYSYFTTCYKKKSNAVDGDQVDFTEELKTFRMLTMQEENTEDEFQKIYARRIENETFLKQVLYDTEKETKEIQLIESNIRDLESDACALKKFQKELQIAVCKIQQNIEEIEIGLQRYNEIYLEIDEENKSKEALIATQKMSAEEARALLLRRNNIKANLVVIRQELSNTESKNFELQPQVYKKLTHIRGKYTTILTAFQNFCMTLLPAETFNKINWDIYDYDKIRIDFVTNTNNPISSLVETIKSEVEELIEKYRDEKRKLNRCIEDKEREIKEMEADADKENLDYKLKFEQALRNVEDNLSLIQTAKCELDIIESRRQTAKNEFQKVHDQSTEVRNRLADTHKLYLQQKNDLEKNYSDIAAGVCEKISLFWLKLEQIVNQKEAWLKLGKKILNNQRKTLENLNEKKSND